MDAGSNPQKTSQIEPYGTATIARAAALICAGDVVAVPTETVYGLAADSTNAAGVAAIYAAKGRPDFNPLIVHVADAAMARAHVEWGAVADQLAAAFWPGPLTLVLPKLATSPIVAAVCAGLGTLAVRCPAHPAMRDLITAVGHPIAAPSANISGAISPTTAAHVLSSLGGRIPMIIDGGACSGGIESTIVRIMDDHLLILRPGAITAEHLAQASGLPVRTVAAGAANGTDIAAPGMLDSHYAPTKPMLINQVTPEPGTFHIGFGAIDGDFNLSASGSLAQAAVQLFAALHLADASDAGLIAVAPVPDTGIGVAINDRLRRAAA